MVTHLTIKGNRNVIIVHLDLGETTFEIFLTLSGSGFLVCVWFGGGRIPPYGYHELSSAYLSPESAKNGLK